MHCKFIHIITFTTLSTSHLTLPRNSPILSSTLPHCLSTALSVLSPSPPQHKVLVCQQTSMAFFITPRRSPFTSLHLPPLVSILILCDDIHTNFDLHALFSFSRCTYHICPLLSNDHISALNDLIDTHHPNIIALTEIWINNLINPSELANVTPSVTPYYQKIISDKTLGGGTAFLILDSISIILNPSHI